MFTHSEACSLPEKICLSWAVNGHLPGASPPVKYEPGQISEKQSVIMLPVLSQCVQVSDVMVIVVINIVHI